MPYLVAIEIDDLECRACVAPMDGAAAAGAQVPLTPIPLAHPEIRIKGSRVHISSVHDRLNPRAVGAGREILDAFRNIHGRAKIAAGQDQQLLAVIAVPGAYGVTQRELVRNLAHVAGFAGAGLVDSSVAAALGSIAADCRAKTVLSICAGIGSFMAAVVDAGPAVCRQRSLEVSSTCGTGGFLGGAFQAMLDSAASSESAEMLAGLNPLRRREIINTLLERKLPLTPAEIPLDGTGAVLSVSERALRTWLEPVIDEWKSLVKAASDSYAPELIYLSPALEKWPIVSDYLGENAPGVPIVSDAELVLVGALRYGLLSPPEVRDAPPSQMPETQMPQGGAESAIFQEIDRLEEREEELHTEMIRTRSKLAYEYDRASQMFRAQGRLNEAWEMSARAVKADPREQSIRKRCRNIGLELATEMGRHHRIPDMDAFMEELRKVLPGDAILVTLRDHRDYYAADHWARCLKNPGKAIEVLQKLCKRNPQFAEAREMLRQLGGRPR